MSIPYADHGVARIARVGLRVLGAVFGGYALTALSVTWAGAVMVRLGMARGEAVVLAAMLGFVAYLALLLWAFSVRSVARLWGVLVGGAMVMTGLLWLVQ
ncbi:iron uptake protein [Polaromonas sp. SM01]|uniref:iron uptake protein n=1 Tax=Polaromonas sp. SM01 TaxID=3085630 RepID=UPI0029824EE6|nr:iron uptake protein [Polaromonas sp. SM01]MDW5443640.1 iron uptake protein [Polaromonas sp. SM01]